MSGQSCCKNKLFTFSKRNYLEDYGNIESKKIDMTSAIIILEKFLIKAKKEKNNGK